MSPVNALKIILLSLGIFILVSLLSSSLHQRDLDSDYEAGQLSAIDNHFPKIPGPTDDWPCLEQRSQYYVLRDYVKASKVFAESVTLCAPGDIRFLDNMVVLAQRWLAPISVALYAPGNDFFATVEAIAYLRSCTVPEIKIFVNFHLFFDFDHIPEVSPNCSLIGLHFC